MRKGSVKRGETIQRILTGRRRVAVRLIGAKIQFPDSLLSRQDRFHQLQQMLRNERFREELVWLDPRIRENASLRAAAVENRAQIRMAILAPFDQIKSGLGWHLIVGKQDIGRHIAGIHGFKSRLRIVEDSGFKPLKFENCRCEFRYNLLIINYKHESNSIPRHFPPLIDRPWMFHHFHHNSREGRQEACQRYGAF